MEARKKFLAVFLIISLSLVIAVAVQKKKEVLIYLLIIAIKKNSIAFHDIKWIACINRQPYCT